MIVNEISLVIQKIFSVKQPKDQRFQGKKKRNEKKIEDKIITYRKEDSKDKLMNREQKRETQEYYEFTF